MADSITAQIAELHRQSVPDLRRRMEELTGRSCRQSHRKFLIKRLAWLIQEQHFGGLGEGAKEQLDVLQSELKGTSPDTWFSSRPTNAQKPSRGSNGNRRDPRLPHPGTVLTRTFRGTEYSVEIMEDGFTFENRPFKSLSSVANAICNSQVNGFTFFRLNHGSK
ncbi:MAG: DUF2924 domain-containing protein [Bacteroidales bacterium]|nr:DUF2924 domain-containing protein [Candidatus Latescibacterota bacterium]